MDIDHSTNQRILLLYIRIIRIGLMTPNKPIVSQVHILTSLCFLRCPYRLTPILLQVQLTMYNPRAQILRIPHNILHERSKWIVPCFICRKSSPSSDSSTGVHEDEDKKVPLSHAISQSRQPYHEPTRLVMTGVMSRILLQM
ncbi:hypothetical protein VKT23_000353 [Stygiomarasmius scandens]|uniref:Uncharacterized protein n=1 Tax=Marasmiellus scandens TaxID=2682957 RepID=A0ABR1K7R0_9AGAR